MRSSFVALAIARSLVEATPFAIVAGVIALGFRREAPLAALWVDTAALLIAWAVLAPRLPTRGRAAMAAATLALAAGAAVGAIGGIVDPGWPAAILAGALYAAALAWRGVSIEATATSWRAAAWAAGSAVLALTVAAPAFEPKRDVVAIAVAAGVAATVALSLARAVQETLATRRAGEPRRVPGGVSSALIAAGALVFAATFPALRPLLTELGRRVAPYAEALLIVIITPFIYLIEAFARAIIPILLRIRVSLPFGGLAPQRISEEYARAVSEQAHVFLEGVAIALVLLVVAAFVARALLSRIAAVRAGATLERESIAGASLRELLRELFPPRAAERPPRPSGEDPASRVRRAYWDLLALAERAGPGWRAPAQTPREHRATLDAVWRRADDIVAAFERLRYGPGAGPSDADGAERALKDLVADVSATA